MARRVSDWRPERIKYALNAQGLTYAFVDRKHELTEGSARIAAIYPHKGGEAALAAELEVLPQAIWPSRYDRDGVRHRPQPEQNYDNRCKFPEIEKVAA